MTPIRGHAANVFRLGVKELWSLAREPMMIVMIVYAFTVAIHTAATAIPDTLNKVPIAIVDEDGSPLSARIASAFYPPYFLTPRMMALAEVDPALDAGQVTFAIGIPPNFQRDVLAGRQPTVQLNVDATRMSQAFVGSGAAQQIVAGEVAEFVQGWRGSEAQPVDLALRMRFNPALDQSWSTSVMELVNVVTMLSIVLTGAALIREREHGTIEHLLVMPVTPAEIMLAKILSMAAVVLVATALSITLVVQGWLGVPVHGSVALYLLTAGLHLLSTTSIGIFLATVARTMPQFGMLIVLLIMPLQMLSGAASPRESMPELLQTLMLVAPTTHYVAASQAILYRGAGFDVVWPQLASLAAVAAAFFSLSLARFRKTIGRMA